MKKTAADELSSIKGRRPWVGTFSDIPEELLLSSLAGSAQRSNKQPTEQPRQHPDREKEGGAAGDPARAVA